MSTREERWHALEEWLTSLINSFSLGEIDQHNRNLLHEFVDNREFGVALEWLDSLVFERSIRFSAEQKKEIERLALLMEIDFSKSCSEK